MAGGHRWDSMSGAKARRARGAYAANASVRAQGRVVAIEANIARRQSAMQRRLQKALDAAPEYETEALHGYTDSSETI